MGTQEQISDCLDEWYPIISNCLDAWYPIIYIVGADFQAIDDAIGNAVDALAVNCPQWREVIEEYNILPFSNFAFLENKRHSVTVKVLYTSATEKSAETYGFLSLVPAKTYHYTL